MEYAKLTYSEIEKLGTAELTQAEKSLRLELNVNKLDVYSIKGKKTPRKGLKKSLARVLTAKSKVQSKVKKS